MATTSTAAVAATTTSKLDEEHKKYMDVQRVIYSDMLLISKHWNNVDEAYKMGLMSRNSSGALDCLIQDPARMSAVICQKFPVHEINNNWSMHHSGDCYYAIKNKCNVPIHVEWKTTNGELMEFKLPNRLLPGEIGWLFDGMPLMCTVARFIEFKLIIRDDADRLVGIDTDKFDENDEYMCVELFSSCFDTDVRRTYYGGVANRRYFVSALTGKTYWFGSGQVGECTAEKDDFPKESDKVVTFRPTKHTFAGVLTTTPGVDAEANNKSTQSQTPAPAPKQGTWLEDSGVWVTKFFLSNTDDWLFANAALQRVEHTPQLVDTSPEMAALFDRNLANWFGGRFRRAGTKHTEGRYVVGEGLGIHQDKPLLGGTHSLLIYMEEPKAGGETVFYKEDDGSVRFRLNALQNRAILFSVDVPHCSAKVIEGTKRVLGCEVIDVEAAAAT